MFELMVKPKEVPSLMIGYRATVVDSYATEIMNGIVKVVIDYIVTTHDATEILCFTEEIVDCRNNPRSEEFFDFLADNEIFYTNYEDLRGLVFDAELALEVHGDDEYLIFVNRCLVAKPAKYDIEKKQKGGDAS